jgi:hypothetical protein
MTEHAAQKGPLAIELAAFEKLLPTLLKDEGKFVLIIGSKMVDVYVAYEDALKAGYKEAGLNAFLVKRISGIESTMHFTRDIGKSCHTTTSV